MDATACILTFVQQIYKPSDLNDSKRPTYSASPKPVDELKILKLNPLVEYKVKSTSGSSRSLPFVVSVHGGSNIRMDTFDLTKPFSPTLERYSVVTLHHTPGSPHVKGTDWTVGQEPASRDQGRSPCPRHVHS